MKNLILSVFTMVSLVTLVSCNGTAGGQGTNTAAIVQSTYYAYVSNFDDDTVSAFRVRGSNGKIEYLGDTGINGDKPYGLARHPNNKFLYVANAGSNAIGVFEVDQTNGDLIEVEQAPAGNFPHALALNSTGTRLYVVNELDMTVGVYRVDSLTGELTFLDDIATGQPTGAAPHDIKVVNDKFVYVANYSTNSNSVNAFKIENDGTLSLIEEQAAGSRPFKLVVSSDNKFLYVINRNSNDISVFSIASNGALDPIQTIATGTTPTSIVIMNGFAYVANFTSNDISIYTVNATTGMLTAADFNAAYGGNPSTIYNASVGIFKHPDVNFLFTIHKTDRKVVTMEKMQDGFVGATGLEETVGNNPQWIEFITVRK